MTYFDAQTDQRTCPVIEMRERKSKVSNVFRYIFFRRKCFISPLFTKALWTDQRTDGRTDGLTDRRTHPLIEMRGRI